MIEEDKLISIKRAKRGFKVGAALGLFTMAGYTLGVNWQNNLDPNSNMFAGREVADLFLLVGENAKDWREVALNTGKSLGAFIGANTIIDAYRPTRQFVDRLFGIPRAMLLHSWESEAEKWLGDGEFAQRARRFIPKLATYGALGGLEACLMAKISNPPNETLIAISDSIADNPARVVLTGTLIGIGFAVNHLNRSA